MLNNPTHIPFTTVHTEGALLPVNLLDEMLPEWAFDDAHKDKD